VAAQPQQRREAQADAVLVVDQETPHATDNSRCSGRSSTNREPRAHASQRTLPPWAAIVSATMLSPRPVPPRREKPGSKTR
jgi:hypothetical protein